MSKIPGINLPMGVVPNDSQDTYPTHYAEYGRGGYRSVATIADRDSIPSERLEEGCVCYVVSNSTEYRWIGGVWKEVLHGAGGGVDAYTKDESDALYQPIGDYVERKDVKGCVRYLTPESMKDPASGEMTLGMSYRNPSGQNMSFSFPVARRLVVDPDDEEWGTYYYYGIMGADMVKQFYQYGDDIDGLKTRMEALENKDDCDCPHIGEDDIARWNQGATNSSAATAWIRDVGYDGQAVSNSIFWVENYSSMVTEAARSYNSNRQSLISGASKGSDVYDALASAGYDDMNDVKEFFEDVPEDIANLKSRAATHEKELEKKADKTYVDDNIASAAQSALDSAQSAAMSESLADAASKALTAIRAKLETLPESQGPAIQKLAADIAVVESMVGGLKRFIQQVGQGGFLIADEQGNVGMKYDESGLDAAKVTEHFKELVNPLPFSVVDGAVCITFNDQ